MPPPSWEVPKPRRSTFPTSLQPAIFIERRGMTTMTTTTRTKATRRFVSTTTFPRTMRCFPFHMGRRRRRKTVPPT